MKKQKSQPTKKEIKRRKDAGIFGEIAPDAVCEICGKENVFVFEGKSLFYFCNVCAWTHPAYQATDYDRVIELTQPDERTQAATRSWLDLNA